MKQRTDSQGVPYSYLVDNIKVVLIFLVVFNHLIAFQLVKVDMVVRYVWYGITIFHMPAFIFISGYLSKKPQDVLKNVKNLLIPYILGYSLTWYAYIWTGRSMDYELLRPSGTVMWYVLALFIYRLTIEALGKIRFIVPLSIIFALWAGTRPEFTTYLSSSRIVVFFPFFVAGYLWKSDYTDVVRKFKGKWILLLVSALLLYGWFSFLSVRFESCLLLSRSTPSCHIAARPCPLKIIAAAHSIDIQHLTCQKQSWNDTGFHCLRIYFVRRNSPGTDLSLIKPFRPCDPGGKDLDHMNQTVNICLCQILCQKFF